QIFLYATSFSPPKCNFSYNQVSGNIVGLSCNSSSLNTQMNVSATGSVGPTSTQVLAPVLFGPQRRLMAPDESLYFNFPTSFSGNTINAQTTKAAIATQVPQFLASSVDLNGCQGCAFNSSGTILNVSYGYLYNLTIPSGFDVSVLPGTLSVAIDAPFDQDNF